MVRRQRANAEVAGDCRYDQVRRNRFSVYLATFGGPVALFLQPLFITKWLTRFDKRWWLLLVTFIIIIIVIMLPVILMYCIFIWHGEYPFCNKSQHRFSVFLTASNPGLTGYGYSIDVSWMRIRIYGTDMFEILIHMAIFIRFWCCICHIPARPCIAPVTVQVIIWQHC